MYDYVIIGGGSAGCVLANRLTADPAVKVLLLEAGGSDQRLNVRIPAAFCNLYHSKHDWDFYGESEPQLAHRGLYMPRGRMLGGSSSMNAMIYIRGHRLDYDGWRDQGCEGWSYDEVLPYFRRAEGHVGGGSEYHGEHGPLLVDDLREPSPLSSAFVEAAIAGGHPANDDFNGARQEGFGLYQVTQKNGRRWSVADAYLKPAMRRPNLTVWTGVHVTRILFENGRAIGVEYRRRRRSGAVLVDREVLLSAGSLQSPQLLMLSGIGPREELAAHGIDVVLDLPAVGDHLQDHPVVAVGYYVSGCDTLKSAESWSNVGRYLLTGGGPLTSNVAEAGGFLRTGADLPAPDLQFHFAPALFGEHQLDRSGDGFTIGVTLVAPRSRGRVTLTSGDPRDIPSIVTRQLTERHDIEVLLEGIRIARNIAAREPLARHVEEEWQPGSEVDDDEALEEHLRRHVELLYHPVGTCRMGSGEGSVVDADLRVHGVEGLRVVDASVMPTIVRGNTNAPTVMIAERAASRIVAA